MLARTYHTWVSPESGALCVQAQGDIHNEHRQDGSVQSADQRPVDRHRGGPGFQVQQCGVDQDQGDNVTLEIRVFDEVSVFSATMSCS